MDRQLGYTASSVTTWFWVVVPYMVARLDEVARINRALVHTPIP